MRKLFIIMMTLFITVYACNDDDVATYVTYPLTVKLLYPDDGVPSEGVKVHLVNNSTGAAFDTVTNAAGIASFLVPVGLYEVSVTDKRSDGGVAYIFNGLKSNISVTADGAASMPAVELLLALSKTGQVVIKELYVGGCQKDDGTGVYQMDKYVILYNNSDHDASLDNLVFGMVHPYNSNASNAYYDDNGNLVYANEGWLPAASGFWFFKTPVTLGPGEQIVVAINGAIKNTNTYTNSVDFDNSSYYCMYDITQFDNTLYYPAPSEVIPASHYLGAYRFALGNAWVLSTSGPAFIIFTPSGRTLENFTNDPESVEPKSGNIVRLKLPVEWVVDGVDIFVHDDEDNLKRLTPNVDAGYVDHINRYGYTVYRNVDAEATTAIPDNAGKLVYNYAMGTADVEGSTDPSGIDAEASIRNGARVIFKDTNNSTNDFHLRKRSSLKP